MRIEFWGGVGTAAAEATGRSLLGLGRRARERLHVDDHDLVVHEIHEDDFPARRLRWPSECAASQRACGCETLATASKTLGIS